MDISMAAIRELLEFHFECLQGTYFNEYHRVNNGALLFSDRITDPYYNFFVPYTPTGATVMADEITAEFSRRDRRPALYLTPLATGNADSPADRQRPWASDAWLIGDASTLATSGNDRAGLHMVLVDPALRETYVATFAEAYSGGDPGDPYGELDASYTDSLRASFGREVDGYRSYYLLATVEGAPAGVANMFTSGGIAGIYGVGTVASYRRTGLGTAMMAYLARMAATDAAGRIMLQTEAGSAVQRWYEGMGYRHAFTADYYELAGGSNR